MALYPFRFDPKYETFLHLIGVTPLTSSVDVCEERLLVRFGPWRLDTPLANVIDSQLSQDFKAHRVIGPHLSLKDKGVTFGTNTDRAVCFLFKDPVKGLDPLGILKHPGLSVTVANPEALQDAVTAGGIG